MRALQFAKSISIVTGFIAIALSVGAAHGQSCWTATHPDGRYIVQATTGTVIDTETRLMWTQCLEGQSGPTCEGRTFKRRVSSSDGVASAIATGESLSFAGYGDWRLPTLAELQTLVPAACASASDSPTINRTVFPQFFSYGGTSTPDPAVPGNSLILNFLDGQSFSAVPILAFEHRYVRGDGATSPTVTAPQTIAFDAGATLELDRFNSVRAVNNNGANQSGQPIIYTTTTTQVCTVNPSTGEISLRPGAAPRAICTILANQEGGLNGGVNYTEAAQISLRLTIGATLGQAARPFVGTTVPMQGNAPGAGSATFTTQSGGTTCRFDAANTGFIAPISAIDSSFIQPQGLFKFRLTNCRPGFTARISITWPQSFEGETYFKYGRVAGAAAANLYRPANLVVTGNTVSFDVTDGGSGDDDLAVNGEVSDPSGPFFRLTIPTLNGWMLMLLSLIAAGMARRQRTAKR